MEAPAAPEVPSVPKPPRKSLIDRLTRRHLLGVALSSLLGAAGIFRTAQTQPAPDPAGPSRDPLFDEMYRGRRIVGQPQAGQGSDTAGDLSVTVDGRPLGLMRRADGSYLSMVDHYESYATPLSATRAAVDELGSHQKLSGRHH
nr:tyrosinase family oxidase copper chaperone [Streptomyces kanamyceticus]